MFPKKHPFDLLLYLCQIVDNFYKNYPVCTLQNVLSNALKNFYTQFGKDIITKGCLFMKRPVVVCEEFRE